MLDKDAVIVQLLYLWTRDARIRVSGSEADRAYLANQLQHLGGEHEYSDTEREDWARRAFEWLQSSQREYLSVTDVDVISMILRDGYGEERAREFMHRMGLPQSFAAEHPQAIEIERA